MGEAGRLRAEAGLYDRAMLNGNANNLISDLEVRLRAPSTLLAHHYHEFFRRLYPQPCRQEEILQLWKKRRPGVASHAQEHRSFKTRQRACCLRASRSGRS